MMITTAKVAFICEKLTNFAQNFYTMVKIGKYNRLAKPHESKIWRIRSESIGKHVSNEKHIFHFETGSL